MSPTVAAKSIADILDDAAARIEPEGAWTQGCYARDASGNQIGFNSRFACSFCAEGAILCRLEGWGLSVQDEADDFFGRILPAADGNPIAAWNDAPGRTQAEVVAKLREAAALAREQGK